MTALRVAVVGSGISGLSAAWLLSRRHHVTLFEAEARCGGHAHTLRLGPAGSETPVDAGFIVFNEATYPNFAALLNTLGVAHIASPMGFSVSLDGGAVEYSGGSFTQLLGSRRTALSTSHWAMMADIARFYRRAVRLAESIGDDMTLGQFLTNHRFGQDFIKRHLLPMAAAIWSSHPGNILDYPAKAFVAFFNNHQLLNFGQRDAWRTVEGGSTRYVTRMLNGLRVHSGDGVARVGRQGSTVQVHCQSGFADTFDHVVIATHADQALALLQEPSRQEEELLRPFAYSDNEVVVHRDATLMPNSRRHWSSWNYSGLTGSSHCSVTYWMNQLQRLTTATQYFVTLNPARKPAPDKVDHTFTCTHPIFNTQTMRAQKQLWSLQGQQNTWFCGAHFGSGFHEDGLQAGLAVAEQLGGVRRPWTTPCESQRICISASLRPASSTQWVTA